MPQDDDGRKRRRIERGKKACLPCRSRKCKCGGSPLSSCPNCLSDGIECAWPTEDGRSSKARKDRARAHRLQSMAVRGLGRPMSKADREASTPVPIPVPGLTSDVPVAHVTSWTMGMPAVPEEGGGVGANGVGADFSLAHLEGLFDPEQFILTMSSQLPTVEADTSPTNLFSSAVLPSNQEGRVVKITWWRPHGPTAIAPGLKRLSLKVRVEPPRPAPPPYSFSPRMFGEEMFTPNGMPSLPVMRHLLDIFEERFGCQFPVLGHDCLVKELEAGRGSVFLFNTIAATAARFATHHAITQGKAQAHEYGNVFAKRAKEMLAAMLAVPSRDTVVALVLMAHVGFGNDSESEEWMFTGMAVRMAIDLGLHLEPHSESDIDPEERRLDGLAFWSVLLLDYALSFGTGRQTTFRIEEITRRLPTQDDICPPSLAGGEGGRGRGREGGLGRGGEASSPFPFAAAQMLAYGPLINLLNGPEDSSEVDDNIAICRAAAVQEYNSLPSDMAWSATNLQLHKLAHQHSIYLHLHLWMHTVIASAYLTSGELRRHPHPGGPSGSATPMGLGAANMWRNSARTIGDMLVLSDVIDPHAYLALPFANQAFYVAGCCYIKEIEIQQERGEESQDLVVGGVGGGRGSANNARGQADLFRSMLASVATSSISTLQAGLARQATYWAGVAWVGGTLAQRVAGIRADKVDLAKVTEQLQTYVSMPDAGLVDKREAGGGGGDGGHGAGEGAREGERSAGADEGVRQGESMAEFCNLDLLTLPFDLGPFGNV